MKYLKATKEQKSYTIKGSPMSKREFVQFVKNSEESGEMDFDKGIEIIEERLRKYRNMKKSL